MIVQWCAFLLEHGVGTPVGMCWFVVVVQLCIAALLAWFAITFCDLRHFDRDETLADVCFVACASTVIMIAIAVSELL